MFHILSYTEYLTLYKTIYNCQLFISKKNIPTYMYYQVHRLQIKTNGKKPPQSHQSALLSLGQWSWMVRSHTMYILHTQFTAPVVCIHYRYIFCQLLFTPTSLLIDKRFALNEMPRETFQTFLYFMHKKNIRNVFFLFDIVLLCCNCTFSPYECPDLCQHRQGHFMR